MSREPWPAASSLEFQGWAAHNADGRPAQLRRGLGKVRPKTSSETAAASQRAGLSGDPGVWGRWAAAPSGHSVRAAASRRRPEPEAAARTPEGQEAEPATRGEGRAEGPPPTFVRSPDVSSRQGRGSGCDL